MLKTHKMRIFFGLLVLTQFELYFSVTVSSISGRISENVTFIHKTFPILPSKRAIIQVDVSYPDRLLGLYGKWPMMGIYTTQDHVNIRKRCTYFSYGQVGNRDLHPSLTFYLNYSRTLKCRLIAHNINCTGTITVQDYLPRKFSFSFGFNCYWNKSLQGLTYYLNIYGTNDTNCSQLPEDSPCYDTSPSVVFPNLLGEEKFDDISFSFLSRNDKSCYEHAALFFCYIHTLKCDPNVDTDQAALTVFKRYTRFLGFLEFPGYHQWQQESQ